MNGVTGARRRVATDAGAGPVTWLRNGRIAYVDTHRRLVVGGRRYAVPRGTIAVAPDGARILYTKTCDVWLANLRTGRVRRFARAGYATAGASWSPDGTHVALGAGWWSNCDDEDYGFDWYHAGTELFDLDGRPLDRVAGGVVGWSRDGRYLLTAGGVTGTEVGALQPLQLVDVRTRTHSTLLPGRSSGEALVTGDGRIVFGRYDDPKAFHEGGIPTPREYAGRLITLAG